MPEEIEQLKSEVEELKKRLDALNSFATIPFNVHKAFSERFQIQNFPVVDQAVATAMAGWSQTLAEGLADAPLATISDPSGGATVDSQARTAINTIIDRMQALGLIS